MPPDRKASNVKLSPNQNIESLLFRVPQNDIVAKMPVPVGANMGGPSTVDKRLFSLYSTIYMDSDSNQINSQDGCNDGRK
jgi:hypothetical protein